MAGSDDVRTVVRERYGAIAQDGAQGCCGDNAAGAVGVTLSLRVRRIPPRRSAKMPFLPSVATAVTAAAVGATAMASVGSFSRLSWPVTVTVRGAVTTARTPAPELLSAAASSALTRAVAPSSPPTWTASFR